jgi:nucleotide-binding universal stress UspA family protein
MSFRTILVPVEQHDLMNSTLETALCLAQKFDSYVEGSALRGTISAAYAMADAAAGTIPTLEQDIAENAKQTRGLFETFMQEHGVPCGAHTGTLSSKWLEDAPEGDDFVGSHGRLFDVIVLGRPGHNPKGSRMSTLEAALFESGRPVLVAPPSPRPQMSTLEAALFESGRPVLVAPPSPRPQMCTNVLIAWNCSTEQARTIAFAMPILRRAGRVVVSTVESGAAVPGPTGQQLCHYLQLSGVPAKPLTVGLNGRLTSEAVLEHANALGCDLLIKGAYTQSRLRQFIFGGTTQYILGNATLPVLMAH